MSRDVNKPVKNSQIFFTLRHIGLELGQNWRSTGAACQILKILTFDALSDSGYADAGSVSSCGEVGGERPAASTRPHAHSNFVYAA